MEIRGCVRLDKNVVKALYFDIGTPPDVPKHYLPKQ